MKRTLVLGFGNEYRRDDGVAREAINGLLKALNRPELALDDDGYDDLGQDVDVAFLHQLVPELTEVVADYDQVVFVDAHVQGMCEDIHEEIISPFYKPGIVTHQLTPNALLAMANELYGKMPQGVLLTIRGHDFDFGLGLSEQTAACVPAVVERLLALTGEG